MLILGGLTLVWLEERIRLLGLIGPMDRSREGRGYKPQHARRR